MDTEAMLEDAIRLLAGQLPKGRVTEPLLAEALLAVEAARVEAVRERDNAQVAFGVFAAETRQADTRAVAAEARAEQAERRLVSEFHDESVYGSRAGLARRVAALEGALRNAKSDLLRYGRHDSDCIVGVAERAGRPVSTEDERECSCGLTAALGDQEAPRPRPTWALSPDEFKGALDALEDMHDQARAEPSLAAYAGNDPRLALEISYQALWNALSAEPLGDQVAPTEPPEYPLAAVLLEHHGDQIHNGLVRCLCGERFENFSGPNGHALHVAAALDGEWLGTLTPEGRAKELAQRKRLHDAFPAAPQVAPEPERCPTCPGCASNARGERRFSFFPPYGRCLHLWHSAPLVEGEQG